MATTTTGTVQPAPGGHEAPAGFPPFKPESFPSQLLWLAISFGVLWYVMSKFALPRVEKLLKDRRDKIFGDLHEAQRLKAEAEAAGKAYEAALAEARRNAGKLADDARAEVNAAFEARRTSAEAELGKKIADAEARIADVRAKAMSEVGGIARESAETIVAHLMGAPAQADFDAAVAAALKS